MNYILTNAKIMTIAPGSRGFANADSILVEHGIIRAIGSLSECRMMSKGRAEVFYLPGKVLLPAFCDTHTHFVELARKRLQLNLDGLDTIDQIRQAALEYRDKYPGDDWVLGSGWDINLIDHPELVHKDLLDCVFTGRPVVLFSKDYHAKWCSSMALQIAESKGFFSVARPEHIKRDAADQLVGLIFEEAAELMSLYVEKPYGQKVKDAINMELEHSFALGLGGFHLMEDYSSLNSLVEYSNKAYKFRIVWHFPFDLLDQVASQGRQSYVDQGYLIIGGAKIFADGALGSRTAAMSEPYTDAPDNKGILRYTQDELQDMVNAASRHGISCTIHAIGDLSIHNVINCLNKPETRYNNKKLLHRIEHLQFLSDESLSALKDSGIYCSMQPLHLAGDIPLIERSLKDREDTAYRFNDLVQSGIPLGFGSDAPIEDINPFKGIYSAIARKPLLDAKLPSWRPQQRIDAETALWAYTYGAAKGSNSQGWTGSLEVGKHADIIAIDDWTDLPDEFWLSQRACLNMIDGHINYFDI